MSWHIFYIKKAKIDFDRLSDNQKLINDKVAANPLFYTENGYLRSSKKEADKSLGKKTMILPYILHLI